MLTLLKAPTAPAAPVTSAPAVTVDGFLIIGRKRYAVASLSDASQLYGHHRDESGQGSSMFPRGEINLGGKHFWVSYNGRVWTDDYVLAQEAS